MTVLRTLLLTLLVAPLLSACVGVQLNTQERSFFTAVGDLNIKTEFNARLLGESNAMFAGVSSTVIEGRLHITGTLPTAEDRRRVTQIAWSIPTVREVVNDIEVAASTGLVDAARDRWISARLRTLMVADTTIRDSNYAIETENGVIYLNGIAQDAAERDRVVAHANAVPEARRVVSYVLVKDDPRRGEGRLAAQDGPQE